MFNFAEFLQDVTVIPKNAGYVDLNGKWIETDDTPFVIPASVQPATAREMEMLPEGRYTSQAFRLYADIRLTALDVVNGINPDIVILGSNFTEEETERFEVAQTFPWQPVILPHYKMIIGKVDQGQ